MSARASLALRALASDPVAPLVILCADEVAAGALAVTLKALAATREVVFLPSSDQLPGDDAPASPANVGIRLAALSRLRMLSCAGEDTGLIVVTTGEAAARRYPAPAAFDDRPPTLSVGDRLDPEAFRALAADLGYMEDDIVDEAGEVCVRGSVVDIFPADAGEPVRIEIDGGAITSLQHYDPATQLSTAAVDAISIGRASEPVGNCPATLLDHLRPGEIMVAGDAEKRRTRFLTLAREAASQGDAKLDAVDNDAWAKAISSWRMIDADPCEIEPVPRFVEDRRPARSLRRFIMDKAATGTACAIMGSARDLRFIGIGLNREKGLEAIRIDSLEQTGDLGPEQVGLVEGPLDAGAAAATVVLIAAADIIGSRAEIECEAAMATAGGALDFLTVEPGDVVIHEDHGVARLLGLAEDPAQDGGEMIALEYARDGRRLVAPAEAGKIWRYGSDADAVTLDTLSGSSWDKRKAAVATAIAATARELVALAEERAGLQAPVIEPDTAAYERFAATFPFNETTDQARAIAAVRSDLASGRPMERLVIGDVGFGKTEVALRAAAMAALAGFQVMVAAPTTVLARQHLREFKRRFAGSGIAVAGLFGSTPAHEKKTIAAAVATNKVQIVVGTAAVAAKGIHYDKLGLVIIDEEQRFGAADKKKLRGRPDVHLLVMSATPIPRTLHRSLVGLQSMSVIATPPARRQPIRMALKTAMDDGVVTALKREKLRRGQSFVVVPRIADLDEAEERLKRLVPELTIIRVHGRMPGPQLDQAMVDFADGKGDILLATNIIETGLNVPRANTMIVWNADRFGLAQLHQLRGRVGRGRRRGTVILLSPKDSLTERSRKRLDTLAHHGQLGAGFAIAASDLDQRGSGDLTSEAQSGHMKLIGIEYYQHLLQGALASVRGEPAPDRETDLRLSEAGSIPRDWIPDANVRLNLYLRLSRLHTMRDVEDFADELADRFGEIPPAAATLLSARALALTARKVGIESLILGPGGCAVTCDDRHAQILSDAGFTKKEDRWIKKPEAEEVLSASAVANALEPA